MSRDRWQDTVLDKCRSDSNVVLERGSKEQKCMEERLSWRPCPKKTRRGGMEEESTSLAEFPSTVQSSNRHGVVAGRPT
jgi:hypothetical protein